LRYREELGLELLDAPQFEQRVVVLPPREVLHLPRIHFRAQSFLVWNYGPVFQRQDYNNMLLES
jgi:hypothetical protein